MLDDGRYDVIVVDAAVADRPSDGPTDNPVPHGLVIEVVVSAGEARGTVVTIHAHASGDDTATNRVSAGAGDGPSDDPVHLLGQPGTLQVVDGRPSLTLDS